MTGQSITFTARRRRLGRGDDTITRLVFGGAAMVVGVAVGFMFVAMLRGGSGQAEAGSASAGGAVATNRSAPSSAAGVADKPAANKPPTRKPASQPAKFDVSAYLNRLANKPIPELQYESKSFADWLADLKEKDEQVFTRACTAISTGMHDASELAVPQLYSAASDTRRPLAVRRAAMAAIASVKTHDSQRLLNTLVLRAVAFQRDPVPYRLDLLKRLWPTFDATTAPERGRVLSDMVFYPGVVDQDRLEAMRLRIELKLPDTGAWLKSVAESRAMSYAMVNAAVRELERIDPDTATRLKLDVLHYGVLDATQPYGDRYEAVATLFRENSPTTDAITCDLLSHIAVTADESPEARIMALSFLSLLTLERAKQVIYHVSQDTAAPPPVRDRAQTTVAGFDMSDEVRRLRRSLLTFKFTNQVVMDHKLTAVIKVTGTAAIVPDLPVMAARGSQWQLLLFRGLVLMNTFELKAKFDRDALAPFIESVADVAIHRAMSDPYDGEVVAEVLNCAGSRELWPQVVGPRLCPYLLEAIRTSTPLLKAKDAFLMEFDALRFVPSAEALNALLDMAIRNLGPDGNFTYAKDAIIFLNIHQATNLRPIWPQLDPQKLLSLARVLAARRGDPQADRLRGLVVSFYRDFTTVAQKLELAAQVYDVHIRGNDKHDENWFSQQVVRPGQIGVQVLSKPVRQRSRRIELPRSHDHVFLTADGTIITIQLVRDGTSSGVSSTWIEDVMYELYLPAGTAARAGLVGGGKLVLDFARLQTLRK